MSVTVAKCFWWCPFETAEHSPADVVSYRFIHDPGASSRFAAHRERVGERVGFDGHGLLGENGGGDTRDAHW